MTKQEVQTLEHGLYRIHWKQKHGGGTSLASVGSMRNGQRWFAPTNWIAPRGKCPAGTTLKDWKAVEKVEVIFPSSKFAHLLNQKAFKK